MTHQFKAKTRHGTHSPFVYDFLEKVLYDRTYYSEYEKLDALLKKNLQDNRTLEFEDLGAGSKKKIRKVKDMARAASATKKQARLLFRMARHYRFEHILELGTNLGHATSALALGNPEAKLTSVEGVPEIHAIAQENLGLFVKSPVELINARFDEVLPRLLDRPKAFDFVYLDGNHRFEPTMNYVNQLLAKSHNDTLIMLDDIHWSLEMHRAWNEILEDPRVVVSIDLFRSGILLLRKEMSRERFYIRF